MLISHFSSNEYHYWVSLFQKYNEIFPFSESKPATEEDDYVSRSLERQEEYTSLLRETNEHLKTIAAHLGTFVNVYAAVHNVAVVNSEIEEE